MIQRLILNVRMFMQYVCNGSDSDDDGLRKYWELLMSSRFRAFRKIEWVVFNKCYAMAS